MGCFVRVLAKLVGPSGRVLAIEPNPGNPALLRAIVRDAAAPVKVVAGGSLVHAHDAAAHPLRRAHRRSPPGVRASEREVLDVDAVVFDDVLSAGADVIRLDTQGTEHVVLRGARRVLARRRPRVLVEF